MSSPDNSQSLSRQKMLFSQFQPQHDTQPEFSENCVKSNYDEYYEYATSYDEDQEKIKNSFSEKSFLPEIVKIQPKIKFGMKQTKKIHAFDLKKRIHLIDQVEDDEDVINDEYSDI